MERYWITGISRGIGAALARALAEPDREIIGLSRTEDPELAQKLAAAGAEYRHVAIDLSDSAAIQVRAQEIFPHPLPATRLCLINNAGTLGTIGPVGGLGSSVAEVVSLNSGALFALSDCFAAAYQGSEGERFVVNITSGLGQRAMAGMALYCATKASVDMFTRVMALDQAAQSNPIQVLAVSPGMVETGMQEAIRAQDSAALPDSEMFRTAAAEGHVQDADVVAQKLVRHLFAERENGAVLHVRDLD